MQPNLEIIFTTDWCDFSCYRIHNLSFLYKFDQTSNKNKISFLKKIRLNHSSRDLIKNCHETTFGIPNAKS